MKKNVMMRAASALLVAVLLTTCAISGTFAKYTTSADASDTARVAKFGVTVAATGTTFAQSYKNDDKIGNTAAQDGVSVQSTVNVVAPGTKGELAKATITGTPEVAVRVQYAATLELQNWTVKFEGADVEYCPLIITVNDETYGINGMKTSNNAAPTHGFDDVATLKSEVARAIGGYSKDYEPGTPLGDQGDNSLSVSWEWAFGHNNDAKDTLLGNKADADLAIVTLSVTTTVTQID